MNTRTSAAATRRKIPWRGPGWPAFTPSLLTLGVAAILLVLGLANIAIRATSHEADDGVLWVNRVEGVTAFEVAPGTPAARAGIKPGDLLEAINGQLVDRPSDVGTSCARRRKGSRSSTGCCGWGRPRPSVSVSRRCRSATSGSTSCWRRSGCSRCWWARACGCAGRATRRRCTSSGWRSPSSAGGLLLLGPARSARLGLLLG